MEFTLEEAEAATILRGVVGSTVHGLQVSDGVDDTDEMAVTVEPFNRVVGFQEFEQHIFRTAAVREGKQDARSKSGDLDLVIYSLRKYLRLALKGNPTILNLLFIKHPFVTKMTPPGEQLQKLHPYIISRKAGGAFLGYLTAQRQRINGEGGQKGVRRLDLEERYGFDVKYAMHMLRLGFEGVELMSTGNLTLPMREPERSYLLDVRTGKVSLQDCLTRAGELERELKDLWDSSPLPKEPNQGMVESWMMNAYREMWGF